MMIFLFSLRVISPQLNGFQTAVMMIVVLGFFYPKCVFDVIKAKYEAVLFDLAG